MAEQPNPWAEPPRRPAEPPAPEPSRAGPGVGVGAGALAAVAVSAALGYWLAFPDRTPPPPAPARAAAALTQPAPKPPRPLRYAGPEPAPGQVKAAFDHVRALYAEGGPGALVKASVDCAKDLQRDPRQLDQCLAFDIYAADILPAGRGDDAAAWFHDRDRDLALARSALPAGSDAADRIGQVRALTTAVLPRPKVERVRDTGRPVARAEPARLRKAKHVTISRRGKHVAHRARLVKVSTPLHLWSSPYCLDAKTEADRIVCSDPSLAAQDRRVREAYGRATATSAEPDVLTQEQANWRAARDAAKDRATLGRLYRERLQDLDPDTPPH